MIPWADHLARWRWEQGDHVTLLGPTKCGKTTLLRSILPLRRHSVVLGCKPRDPTLERMAERADYRIVRRWEQCEPDRRRGSRYILWPKAEDPDELEARQYVEFRSALRDAFSSGGWALGVDELSYLVEYLNLERDLKRLWYQGRSNGNTVLAAAQAPVYLPGAAFDQPMSFYLWKTNDLRRVKRLAEITGGAVDPALVASAVRGLDHHQVLYVDGITGDMRRTTVDAA